MKKLIELNSYPVNVVLEKLLKDKTTKKNIIFATDIYGTDVKAQITEELLLGLDAFFIQPRVAKSLEEQSERTRKKAEVFTPSWICNRMNNHCDVAWFDRENVFNTENGQTWITNEEKVLFTDKSWQEYVESRRLEITCGEAPYIVSRYDAATGELIKIKNRIGILDRKLRVVNENVMKENEWIEWVYRAYQSVYGYEFQGDNLLIARINLLNTFCDYVEDRWNRKPTNTELRKITNVIVWNFWQMDGISGTIPFGRPEVEYEQISFFDFMLATEDNEKDSEQTDCRIYDWKANKSIKYNSLKGE